MLHFIVVVSVLPIPKNLLFRCGNYPTPIVNALLVIRVFLTLSVGLLLRYQIQILILRYPLINKKFLILIINLLHSLLQIQHPRQLRATPCPSLAFYCIALKHSYHFLRPLLILQVILFDIGLELLVLHFGNFLFKGDILYQKSVPNVCMLCYGSFLFFDNFLGNVIHFSYLVNNIPLCFWL